MTTQPFPPLVTGSDDADGLPPIPTPALQVGADDSVVAAALGVKTGASGNDVKSPATNEYVSHREICGRVGRPSFASIRKYLFY